MPPLNSSTGRSNSAATSRMTKIGLRLEQPQVGQLAGHPHKVHDLNRFDDVRCSTARTLQTDVIGARTCGSHMRPAHATSRRIASTRIRGASTLRLAVGSAAVASRDDRVGLICAVTARPRSPTARSANHCSSARRPSRPTSRTSTPSSTCATASKPSYWPTKPGSLAARRRRPGSRSKSSRSQRRAAQDASTARLIAWPKSGAPLRAARSASGAMSLPTPRPSSTL